MTDTHSMAPEALPFFITGPGQGDILFTAVAIVLILVILGFGAFYFTVQSIPDRMVEGASKTQMQLVSLLGLISLVTMNNAFWVAALLLAAIRLPDFGAPFAELRKIRAALAKEDRDA